MKLILLVIAFFVAFGLGFATHHKITAQYPISIRDHWAVVNEYNKMVKYPENATPKFWSRYSVDVPIDLKSSLFALVAAGELDHVSLVFPKVPRSHEVIRLWLDFEKSHDEIVHSNGNYSPADYDISGEQPTHIELWFKPEADYKVQMLVEKLEALGSSDDKM